MGPYTKHVPRYGSHNIIVTDIDDDNKDNKDLSIALITLPDWEGLNYIQTASLHNWGIVT
jgi:hypothetical protein